MVQNQIGEQQLVQKENSASLNSATSSSERLNIAR